MTDLQIKEKVLAILPTDTSTKGDIDLFCKKENIKADWATVSAIANAVRRANNKAARAHLKFLSCCKDSCGIKHITYLNTITGENEVHVSGKSMGVKF
jgi:hypothetical protein